MTLNKLSKGQSAGEYGLVGALVVLVSIGALGSLSGVFNTKLSDINSKYSLSPTSSFGISPLLPTAATSAEPTAFTAKTSNNAAGSSSISVTLSNGQKLLIDGYPTKPAKYIETSGVSGYTTQLAQSLKILAQKLEAQGKLTPTQSVSLINLANQGFNIGDKMKFVEETLKSNADPYQPVIYKGAAYKLNEIALALGSNTNGVDTSNLSAYYNAQDYSDLKPLVQFYQQAEQDGSLEDPGIKYLVNTMTLNIAALGDTIEESFVRDSMGDPVYKVSNINTNAQSNATKASSGIICDTGNGNKNGASCQ